MPPNKLNLAKYEVIDQQLGTNKWLKLQNAQGITFRCNT